MFSPMVLHILWNTAVEPVKCSPAKSGCVRTLSAVSLPLVNIKLITPSGSPASLNTSIITFAAYICLSEAFQTTTFPSIAIQEGRFPAIAVKLNGVRAKQNPSNGLYSTLFQIPLSEIGCSEYISVINSALNLRKSISSQAESISA